MGQVLTDDNGRVFVHDEKPSRVVRPFREVGSYNIGGLVREFENEIYTVTLREYKKGFFIKDSEYKVLGIINADQTARHDWREFQQIKNLLVGRDWEGVELYPSESRLVDPSNEFFMWCVPRGLFKFGLPTNRRNVLGSKEARAPQRPFG